MREETIIEAINDIDSIRCMVEDVRDSVCAAPDYWEKLKHQYAGMAMQGMLSNAIGFDEVRRKAAEDGISNLITLIAGAAKDYATALVEKLKNE